MTSDSSIGLSPTSDEQGAPTDDATTTRVLSAPAAGQPPLVEAPLVEAQSVEAPPVQSPSEQPPSVQAPSHQPPDTQQRRLPDDEVAPSVLDVTVVLPCYNEQLHVITEVDRICDTLDASGLSYEVLAIDDKSTDDTLALLRQAAARRPQVRVMAFGRNGGSGTARRIGTEEARGRVVVWTDADMTYPNERIPELVGMLAEDPSIDQVVGARTSEEGTLKVLRVPAKWAIRKLAEALTDTDIPDLNSGLRAFRRDVSLPYLRLLPPGFSCVTTITLSFLSNQHQIRYVPIDYAKRSGTSKFHFASDAYRYILQVLRMIMYFNPLKVLMPVALVVLGLGVAKGFYDVIDKDFRVTTMTVLLLVTGFQVAALGLLADLVVRSRGD